MTIAVPDPLCNINTVKALLNITDASEDVALNFYILSASQLITTSCNRWFFLASNAANPITEYYSGDGNEWLTLNQWPVQSITSIYLDDLAYWNAASGAFATQTLLTAGVDYALKLDNQGSQSDSAMVFRINNVWDSQWARDGDMLADYITSGRGNIKVTYTVGYSTLPSDLSFACAMVVAKMRNSFPYGQGISSERFEEYSYILQQQLVDRGLGYLGGEVGAILARYRIHPVI